MAKKDNAVYAPGELGRVRDRLGAFDAQEAKELAKKLGGKVGVERSEEQDKTSSLRKERVNVKIKGRPGRKLDTFQDFTDGDDGFSDKKQSRQKGMDPADDPTIPVKASYRERIKMDRLAGQAEFEIKSPTQVLISIFSIFSDVTDSVNPGFVTRRMPEYYKKIELLVISTRNMLPRNNTRRSERMKKSAPLAYSVIDIIRYWDIEKISGELARIQANPKNVRVTDFIEILRAIYKPLYILGQLELDAHIRGAYKILYKILYLENPGDAQIKYQEPIRTALAAYSGIYKDIHYLLYPLFLKIVSSSFVPYETLFTERKNRISAFLNVSERDQINPESLVMQGDAKDLKGGDEQQNADPEQPEEEEKELSKEEKERLDAVESEKKALERGLRTLEVLFPKAGWDRLSSYPDLYPYFVEIFGLKKGIVYIAPTDPMQQVLILMRILNEFFFGLRYVSFTAVPGSSGNMERVDNILGEIINEWHYYIDTSFEKEYLPRMSEYVRILEGSFEERSSHYTKKLVNELNLIKRYCLLPFYKFEAFMSPSMQKKDTLPVYTKIRTLRKYLSAVAACIEQANRSGGAEANVPCDGVENPWKPYAFQVPNPISIRLDALLPPKQKNNASLIYFCLAVATVLDHLVNNENSWAYTAKSGPLFRSLNGEGVTPLTGVDTQVDADGLFKKSLKKQ